MEWKHRRDINTYQGLNGSMKEILIHAKGYIEVWKIYKYSQRAEWKYGRDINTYQGLNGSIQEILKHTKGCREVWQIF